MKTLIIVESPTKAKTIQKYLGENYVVLASKGHVCDLPQKSLGIDLENRFQPQYIVTPDKKETIKTLKSAVTKYRNVFLATDPDREGEAISWHLKNELGIDTEAPRIEFHEISKTAVTTAIGNPRPLDMNLVNSQQARRVLDRLVGYKISPVLSKKVKRGSSAGRVQSAALEMIVTRHREILDFVPEEYWVVKARLSARIKGAEEEFTATFAEIDGEKYKPHNQAQADRITDMMRGADFSVESVKRKKALSNARAPFTTSTMTQDAASKLGLSSEVTMKLAQQLYEGIDIEGEGMTALITYIRTDSVRVAPEFTMRTLDYVRKVFGEDYAPKKPNFYATKGNAQDAHEAIRPITLENTPEKLKNKLKRDQYRLYKLIYDRYVASQMSPIIYNTLTVDIVALNPKMTSKKLGFKLSGRAVAFKGYSILYDSTPVKEDEDGEEGALASIPPLKEGDALELKDLNSTQKFTKPPVPYNEGTIIKAMEENGIGRPSTYATIVPVLLKREYIVREGKSLVPTDLGMSICDYMLKFFPEIMNLTFTARMEGALDKISEGEGEWQTLIEGFYPNLQKRLKTAIGTEAERPADIPTDIICEKCGAAMVIKEGKFGKFLACPNYPKCKNTRAINEPVGKCPVCGHDIYKRTTKKGKDYFACSNYPACDFKSWNPPAPKLCPQCQSTMRVVGEVGKQYYVCTNKDCRHREKSADVSDENDG